jgi:hypothetical protein
MRHPVHMQVPNIRPPARRSPAPLEHVSGASQLDAVAHDCPPHPDHCPVPVKAPSPWPTSRYRREDPGALLVQGLPVLRIWCHLPTRCVALSPLLAEHWPLLQIGFLQYLNRIHYEHAP